MMLKVIENCIFELKHDIEMLEYTQSIYKNNDGKTSQAILRDKKAIDILSEIYSY